MEYYQQSNGGASSSGSSSDNKYSDFYRQQEDDDSAKQRSFYARLNFNVCSVGSFVCGLGLTIVVVYIHFWGSSSASVVSVIDSTSSVESLDGAFKLTSTNEYGTFDPTSSSQAYPFLTGSLLLEPYRSTVISLSSYQKNCEYSLVVGSVNGNSNDDDNNVVINEVDGFSWDLTIQRTGKYNATVSSTCDDDNAQQVTDIIPIWVKYVRRELSTLTDSDREDFLNAMYTLYTVNTVDGQALYGSNYRSVQYLTSIHVDAAGNPVCDEFHSGSGFFSNHVLLSNYFEQSLRLVNPKVSLHFMEYAQLFSSDDYASHMSNQLDGGTWNPYLSDAYFGSSDPVTGDILDSIWAAADVGVSIPVVNSQFFLDHGINENSTFFPDEEELWLMRSTAHLRSPFSLLRPPWNFNPSTSVARYNNEIGISSILESSSSATSSDYADYFQGSNCNDYQSFLDTYIILAADDQATSTAASTPDFNTVLRYVKSMIHGGIHENFGGAGGQQALLIDQQLQNEPYNLSDNDLLVISERAHAFFKKYVPMAAYYNDSDYPVYPLKCDYRDFSSDASESRGYTNCTCADYYFESEDQVDDLMSLYFEKYMKPSFTQHSTPASIIAKGFDANVAIMRLICQRMTVAFDGDFVGSGSAFDPIFWVSHQAMEFLLQRVSSQGYFQQPQGSGGGGYNFTESTSSCSGHTPTAYPYWTEGYRLDDGTDASAFTNQEMTWMLDPMTTEYAERIPYIYDSLHKTGCDYVDTSLSLS
jgi:hypothetical protein